MDAEEKERLREKKELRKRSKEIDKLLKNDAAVFKQTIKLLLLGTGESGKSTILKQMRIIHISKFSEHERVKKINDIKSNIRDSILSILDAMERFGIQFENQILNEPREYVYENIDLIFSNSRAEGSIHDSISPLEKLWDCIEALWKDGGVKKCARRGNEYHLIDSAPYFLDRVHLIRSPRYLPDEQDILRCRVRILMINVSPPKN